MQNPGGGDLHRLMEKLTALLQKIYLFKELTPDEVDRIARIVETKSYNAGQTIFYKGEAPRAIYFIGLGTVKLVDETEGEDYGMLGTGAHFGELPFLDDLPHQFTVRASEPTQLYELPHDKLRTLLLAETKIAADFYRSLAHFLSTRLRQVTNDLLFTREHDRRRHHG